MKTLKEYFFESKEDGKYLDLPKYMNEPWIGPWMSKEQKSKIKSDYKAYKESVKQINEENFEILIDKFLSAIKTKEVKNNFLLNSSNCKFTVYLNKEKGEEYRDYFDDIEEMVARARIALESDEVRHMGEKTRKKENNSYYSNPNVLLRFWDDEKQFSSSIYNIIAYLAQAYNIDIPKFSEENFSDLFTASSDEIFDKKSHVRRSNWSDERYSKERHKAEDEFNKNKEKVKKARDKFRKTDLYKNILEILSIVEDDLAAADENYTRFEARFKEAKAKTQRDKDIADAIIEVTDKVNDIIKKEFHSPNEVSFYVNKLYAAVAAAYLDSDKQFPDIEVTNRSTGSWLAGMKHRATFNVKGKNGKDYGSITMEDRGLDNTPGFGPWD